uniref:T-cell immunoglobulin and mucin domain-containing protein 4-like n=1 Tax=Cynoglossus semilaevis TaxID=244447 RepID=A0A3P8V5D7_CYNSE
MWADIVCVCVSTVSGVDSSQEVSARPGQNVTLSCQYNVESNGVLSVCWNRGPIPRFGCSEQLIATDRERVKEETRASGRYQLLGHLDGGDVSLTIVNVTAEDAGQYGCRVDVPGWFNDQKHHFVLSLETVPRTTSVAAVSTETSPYWSTATWTPGHMTSAVFTSSVISVKEEVSHRNRNGTSGTDAVANTPLSVCVCVCVCVQVRLTTSIVVSVLCVVLVIAASVLVVVFAGKWRKNKVPQVLHTSVRFSSSLSTLQLHSQEPAPENVYQLDDGGEYDGGEYDYCP